MPGSGRGDQHNLTSLLRTGWQPLEAPERFLCADFGPGSAAASQEMGMSVALGRDVVPTAGLLLTQVCRLGRGCKHTSRDASGDLS